jgi:hypothetical protein
MTYFHNIIPFKRDMIANSERIFKEKIYKN